MCWHHDNATQHSLPRNPIDYGQSNGKSIKLFSRKIKKKMRLSENPTIRFVLLVIRKPQRYQVQDDRRAEYFKQNSPLFTDPRDPIYAYKSYNHDTLKI